MTWNLFLTVFLVPLCVGLLGMYFKRSMDDHSRARDKKDERIEILLKEKDLEKERSLNEWRQRYTDTQNDIKSVQCAIKNKLDEIGKDLQEKVPWEHCVNKEKEHKESFRDVDLRLRGLGK